MIDVLAPEGLGRRADLTTTPPGRTIQVPGGTQALARTELLSVTHEGIQGHIPRPSLLGAIIVKAAAASVHRDRQIQLGDLALLLSLVEDPPALAPQLVHKDRMRLRAVTEIASPDHAIWDDLTAPEAARARLTLRTLLPSASPATNPALRISAGSDGGEERPVGSAGVEQRPDPVVREAAETEGGALDASGEVVDRFGGADRNAGAVPAGDRLLPAAEGAAPGGAAPAGCRCR